MSDLIKALQILLKYGDPRWPTICEHDVMYFCVDPAVVSAEDKAALDSLGVFVGTVGGDKTFMSHRFGSA